MKITKDKIMASATTLMQQRGYDGVSIKDVADSVGLRKSSIYSHFSSKDELVVAILDRASANFSENVCLTGDVIGDFRKSLGYIVDYLKEPKKCLGMQLVYNSGSNNKSVMGAAGGFFLTLKNGLAATLNQNTNLPSEVIKVVVEDSISRIEGATLWLIIDDDIQPLNRAVESSIRTVELFISEYSD